MESHSHHHDQGGGNRAGRWVFWGFVLVAAYFLYTEHRAHLVAVLPYLLLAACPLMHLFHHHGGHRHGGAGGEGGQQPQRDRLDDTSRRPHQHRH